MILDKNKVLSSFYKNEKNILDRYEQGLQKYRKGVFTLKFSDFGRKKVEVKQVRHKFLFGCNAFMLDSVEIPEKEEVYKNKFVELFNQAVVPFYWSDLEPEEGKPRFSLDSVKIYRRPAPDVVLDFCKKHNIEPKGHCLAWNSETPEWLVKYNSEERKIRLEKRFKEISERYSDKIPSWDIVNESASNYNLGRKTLFEDYDEYALMLGGKYFCNNRKIINEMNYAIGDTYITSGKYMPFNMQLREFVGKGLPIDEIGIQFHIFTSAENFAESDFDRFLNAENHLEILDIFGSYGKPMHISEITIPSYPDNIPENEDIQAKLVEYYYKIWFSTPNMKSIVWWNLVDGYAYGAPKNTFEGENYYAGGLLRYDMTEKPSYRILKRLINEEWKTAFEKTIDGDHLEFCGFYGDYEITVEDGKGVRVESVKLNDSGATVEL